MAESDLSAFISEVTGDSHLRVEDDFGGGFVRLRSAEAERRQAKHDIRGSEDVLIELLRNARDAHARNIFVATAKEGARRTLTVIDDGDGVPERMREKIFEARVTSKLDTVHMDTWGIHGRGMALYAISVNAMQARVAASKVDGGSSFFVVTDTNKLPEKTDQSTRPIFGRTESGTITVRGPRNLYRTVAEFAYIERNGCTVYCGSPIEMAATLWEFGRAVLSASARVFCDDIDSVPVCKRLALASDPEHFAAIARSMGLELSSRSARRIMDGEIASVSPVAEQISVQDADVPAMPNRTRKRAKRKASEPYEGEGNEKRIARVLGAVSVPDVKLSEDDLQALEEALQNAWTPIAASYYLDGDVEASASVRNGRLYLSLPIRPAQD